MYNNHAFNCRGRYCLKVIISFHFLCRSASATGRASALGTWWREKILHFLFLITPYTPTWGRRTADNNSNNGPTAWQCQVSHRLG